MIALIAKSILTRGEHPIFVWQVGYNGILVLSHAMALVFKLFGSNAYTANIAPALFFILFLIAFFKVNRLYFGPTLALLIILLIALSSPSFYNRVLRAEPNYNNTFIFGMILIWCQYQLIERLYLRRASPKKKDFIYAAIFGFVSGFGIYSNGQIFYFLSALLLHSLLLLMRSGPDTSLSHFFRNTLNPASRLKKGGIRKLFSSLAWINWFHFSFAAITFIFDFKTVQYARFSVRWDSIAMLQASVEALIVLNLGFYLVIYFDKIKFYLPLLGTAVTAGLLGYSPTLYYRYVIKGVVAAHTGVGGTAQELLNRMGWMLYGQAKFLNLTEMSLLSLLAGAGAVFFVAVFLKNAFKQINQFVLRKSSKSSILYISPVIFLLPVATGIFVASHAALHWTTFRYLAVVTLFYAVAISSGAAQSWLVSKTRKSRVMIAFALSCILINNAWAFIQAGRSVHRPYHELVIMDWMNDYGIRHGYADYYYGYSITFLSDEKIIMEPLYSNYSPTYGPIVAQADHIAYIDYPARIHEIDHKVRIGNFNYRILDQKDFGAIRALRLQKIGLGIEHK